jgi:DNA topoisomerase-1
VTAFLINFFKKYVEYNFTADLEEQLDEISAGDMAWKKVLGEFWASFSEAVSKTSDLKITDVINALEHDLQAVLFPQGDHTCPQCKEGKLNLKLGKFGAFVGCSNYPDCRYTRPVLSGGDSADGDATGTDNTAPRELGMDPVTNLPVTLRHGPYGPYVQLGPAEGQKPAPQPVEEPTDGKKKKKKAAAGEKPKRGPVPRNMDPSSIDLDKALKLLSLPREVGLHPETGEMIKAGIGRFGPFLVHQGKFKSIPADDPEGVLTIGLNRAVDLLAQQGRARGAGGGFAAVRELGAHPEDGKPVNVYNGRYGPYVKHGGVNATIPKGSEIEGITLEQAIQWLNERKEKEGTSKKSSSRKPAAKKAAAPKAAAKAASKSAGSAKTKKAKKA